MYLIYLNDNRNYYGDFQVFFGIDIFYQIDFIPLYLSPVMRKLAFCLCENKDADQLRGNCEADQCLCFRYIDRTIPLVPKYQISSLQSSSVVAQPGLCRTWSETPKTGFLTTRLISFKTTI